MKERVIDYSVPQGSVAEWQFFHTYASTLFDVIPENTGLNSFTDDHTIHNAYNLNDKYECMSAMHFLKNALLDVEKWMSGNQLWMNLEKMEFIVFGSRTQFEKLSLDKVEGIHYFWFQN